MRNHGSTLRKKRDTCDQIFMSEKAYVADVQNTEGWGAGRHLEDLNNLRERIKKKVRLKHCLRVWNRLEIFLGDSRLLLSRMSEAASGRHVDVADSGRHTEKLERNKAEW